MSSTSRIFRVSMLAVAIAAVPYLFESETAVAAGGYAAPRFPKYLRTVTTVEPLMLPARLAARQIAGRTPLGLVKSGEHVFIVTPDEQDPLVWEAIKKALEERGVKVSTAKSYEMSGLTKAQADANDEVR